MSIKIMYGLLVILCNFLRVLSRVAGTVAVAVATLLKNFSSGSGSAATNKTGSGSEERRYFEQVALTTLPLSK